MGGDQTSLAYHEVSIKAVPYPHISSYCVLKLYLMQLEEMKISRVLKLVTLKLRSYNMHMIEHY